MSYFKKIIMKKYFFLLFTIFLFSACKEKEIAVQFKNDDCIGYGRCCNPQNLDECVTANLQIGRATLFDDKGNVISEIEKGITYLNLKKGTYQIKYDCKVILKNGKNCNEFGISFQETILDIFDGGEYKTTQSWTTLPDQTQATCTFFLEENTHSPSVNVCNRTYTEHSGYSNELIRPMN